MEKKYSKNNKLKAFLKRNMYYIIMSVCIVAIGAMITVAVVVQNNEDGQPHDQTIIEDPVVDPDDDKTDPVINPDPIIFALPAVSNNILQGFEEVCMSVALNQWWANKGIHFGGEDGDSVVAAYDGTVIKSDFNILDGGVVVIDHGDGLQTYYGSLQEGSMAAVGQTVTKGDTIGKMSDSATSNMHLGANLDFRVLKDSVLVDPADYLPTGDK